VPSGELDGGEALLEACRDLGVDYIFSSPGSEWAPVWEALARARAANTPGPTYLDLTHETLAVAMAAGYAAVTGRVQVVLLHAAAGLLQGANAIHGALLTGVPMLVCSGESTGYGDGAGPDPGSQWYRNLSVVGGPQAIAASFTKWANSAADAAVLHGMLTRAGELAAAPPAGPAYLNVPVEVLLSPWRQRPSAHPVASAGRTISAPHELDIAVDLLRSAERPLIVTESGGRTPAQWDALLRFAEAYAIPVVEPQSAVCANFPRSHPLHQGGDLAGLAEDADLLVLVNCRAPWYPPSAKPGRGRVLVIDEVPQRPHLAYQVLDADHYVAGDSALALGALVERLAEQPIEEGMLSNRRESAALRHDRAESSRQADEEAAESADGAGPVEPALLVKALRQALRPEDVVVDETITHSRVVARHLLAASCGRYHYVQGGLGQGTGVALGVKLARRESMVVLTVGDGALLYNPLVQALMASRDLDLPLLVVVFNNGRYLSMRHNHVRAYPDGVAVQTGAFFGVDLSGQPDVAEIAGLYGMAGWTVRTSTHLATALDAAVSSVRAGTTAIVNVRLTR
jgi:acetolactate synthase I/II/III large subunit